MLIIFPLCHEYHPTNAVWTVYSFGHIKFAPQKNRQLDCWVVKDTFLNTRILLKSVITSEKVSFSDTAA